jgi:hypothetical protein
MPRHVPCVQIGRATAMLLVSVLTVACGPGGGGEEDDPQRLSAIGQVFEPDGTTPATGMPVNRYNLFLVVPSEEEDITIQRSFTEDASGKPIVTDADGRFQIASEDLSLYYDWYRDELVCEDVCVEWETQCEWVSEEICLDTCTELECYDDCYTECWDETVCDEFGDCWVETYCEDVCEEVCDPVDYPCDCYIDTYEVCGDVCSTWTEDCGYVTRTFTSYALLEDVLSTSATIDVDGATVEGTTLEAYQHNACDEAGACELINLWIQNDSFTLP